MKSLFAVIAGGSLGCIIRWLLTVKLNPTFPALPPGTLLVNLMGGLIIGGAMAWFMKNPPPDPAWKLLIMTGLCGGMTTFSTFSAEVINALQSGNVLWAFITIFVHVTGSLIMTAVGYMLINILV